MIRYSSPLRYPGGKQKLAPFILEVLQANGLIGGHYVEPYAGGAGIAIALLLAGKVSNVHLNDSSYPIFAFWNSVLTRPEEFCRLIRSASLTVEEWKRRREIINDPSAHDELDVGFTAFYLNRCNRSGVLSGGLIGGIDQKSTWKMDARFTRNELIRRVELVASVRESITLRNLDAEEYIVEYLPTLPGNTLVYCDPPYFDKSSRLYLDYYNKEDHSRIAALIQAKLQHRWLVSYDSAFEILNYYRDRRAFLYDLQYNASRVYKGKEVMIFSDELQIPESSSLPNIDMALHSSGVGTLRHQMSQ